MAKEEGLLAFEGMIEEVLPDGRFRVLLDNQHSVIAYTAGRMRRNRIRSVLGDRVHVEMTPYDLDKGRLIYREPTARGPSAGPRRSFRR
jgi:translation initiation factor IF-1